LDVIDRLIGDAATLGEALASDLKDEGTRALEARGRFTIAIPGGSVAAAFFPHLARLSFDWSRTEFFWTDERAVAPDDPESNYALARTLWLQPARVPDANIHRMPADRANLDAVARTYGDELKRITGDPPRLDFVLLGVGVDGHVASLFPGHPALSKEHEVAVAVADAPKPPPRRMTLTLPVLVSARRSVVAALGKSKARVIYDALGHAALERDESALPVALVLRQSERVLLLLDPEAAANVTGGARALAGKSRPQ
jgi:6-phosphogluconolactonase